MRRPSPSKAWCSRPATSAATPAGRPRCRSGRRRARAGSGCRWHNAAPGRPPDIRCPAPWRQYLRCRAGCLRAAARSCAACSPMATSLPAMRPSASCSRFIGGVPMKRADEGGGRARVQVARAADLLDAALVEQHHLVGHAHRLGLVVGDVDHRQPQLALQLAQFMAHVLAQLRVQVGQRLVHQAHLGLRHQRAAQRHALLLAAGQLRGLALQQRRQAQQLGHLRQPRLVFRRRQLAHRQAEADVLRHVQVREQRVVLEHHGNAALCRRQVR